MNDMYMVTSLSCIGWLHHNVTRLCRNSVVVTHIESSLLFAKHWLVNDLRTWYIPIDFSLCLRSNKSVENNIRVPFYMSIPTIIEIKAEVREGKLHDELLLQNFLPTLQLGIAIPFYLDPDQISASAARFTRQHESNTKLLSHFHSSASSSLVKLMVTEEGLKLGRWCTGPSLRCGEREVVKVPIELRAAHVNCSAGTMGKIPLHVVAEIVSPDVKFVEHNTTTLMARC